MQERMKWREDARHAIEMGGGGGAHEEVVRSSGCGKSTHIRRGRRSVAAESYRTVRSLARVRAVKMRLSTRDCTQTIS